MVEIQVCIGSSCHLKGAPRIVELLKEKIEKDHLEDKIKLVGSFCTGNCNRNGVTIIVNKVVHIGITPEGFNYFWESSVLNLIDK